MELIPNITINWLVAIFRLDPIQASVLRVKLPYLDGWHRQRAANAERYNLLFAETELLVDNTVQLPASLYAGESDNRANSMNVHIYNQYVVRVQRRNELRQWLSDNDIGCEIYYPVPLHKQECLGNLVSGTHCPEAEKAADETLALPIYPELTSSMQSYIVEKIVQFYR